MDCRKLLSISALLTEIHPAQKQNIVKIPLVLWGMIHMEFHVFLSLSD
jgi:hypothetical protein